jgi:hypothetical protein
MINGKNRMDENRWQKVARNYEPTSYRGRPRRRWEEDAEVQ